MMTGLERKVALLQQGVTMTSIAAECRRSLQHVSQVIKGERRSDLVERVTAKRMRRPVREVFAPRVRRSA